MNTKLLNSYLVNVNKDEIVIFKKKSRTMKRIVNFYENHLLKILTISFSILVAKEIALACYRLYYNIPLSY